MKNNNNTMSIKWKNLKCSKCGKTNIGWQSNCLLCGADLMSLNMHKEPIYKCPSCDDPVNKGQKFCTSCGYKLPEDLAPIGDETPKVKKCQNCGATLKVGAKFCTECGTKV